jgi:hypothetical protein
MPVVVFGLKRTKEEENEKLFVEKEQKSLSSKTVIYIYNIYMIQDNSSTVWCSAMKESYCTCQRNINILLDKE